MATLTGHDYVKPARLSSTMRRPSTTLQTSFFERNGALFLAQHNGDPDKGHCVHLKVRPGDRERFKAAYDDYKHSGGKL